MPNQNPTLNIAKGIAILLVVYGHVLQRHMVVANQDFFLHPVFKFIYTFHMPLFFFISGFLLANSLNGKKVGEVFQSRLKRLLIPFISWTVSGVIVTLALFKLDGFAVNGEGVYRTLVDQMILNPAVWFLWTLFAIVGLTLISRILAQKFGPVAHALWASVIVFFPFNQYASLYLIQWFYVFFIVGYGMFYWKINIEKKYVPVLFLLCVIGFLLLQMYWQKIDYIYINKMTLLSFQDISRLVYRYVVGFLGIGVVMSIAWQLSRLKQMSFLAQFGLYSLDIYLLQRYIVEGFYTRVIAKWPTTFDHHAWPFWGVYAPIAAVLFVLLCVGISVFIIRKNQFLATLLLGVRK